MTDDLRELGRLLDEVLGVQSSAPPAAEEPAVANEPEEKEDDPLDAVLHAPRAAFLHPTAQFRLLRSPPDDEDPSWDHRIDAVRAAAQTLGAHGVDEAASEVLVRAIEDLEARFPFGSIELQRCLQGLLLARPANPLNGSSRELIDDVACAVRFCQAARLAPEPCIPLADPVVYAAPVRDEAHPGSLASWLVWRLDIEMLARAYPRANLADSSEDLLAQLVAEPEAPAQQPASVVLRAWHHGQDVLGADATLVAELVVIALLHAQATKAHVHVCGHAPRRRAILAALAGVKDPSPHVARIRPASLHEAWCSFAELDLRALRWTSGNAVRAALAQTEEAVRAVDEAVRCVTGC